MTGFVTKKLSRKRTLGSIFKAARSKAELTLAMAEAQTKICAKYLIALEEGNYSALPAEAYNIGFVRTYADFLHLNQEKVLRLYREERSASRFQSPRDNLLMTPKRMGDWQFLITPKLIGILTTVVIFGGMISYIFLQLQKFSQPPTISMNVPSEFTSDKDTVKLSGKTTGGSIVTVNAEPILVSPDGNFTQDVQLAPGINEFVIDATNRAQNKSQVAVKVLYDKGVAKLPASVTTE